MQVRQELEICYFFSKQSSFNSEDEKLWTLAVEVEINNAFIAEPFYTQYCYYTQDSFWVQSQVMMGHLFANVVMLVVI